MSNRVWVPVLSARSVAQKVSLRAHRTVLYHPPFNEYAERDGLSQKSPNAVETDVQRRRGPVSYVIEAALALADDYWVDARKECMSTTNV
jgi:hypothetical protein